MSEQPRERKNRFQISREVQEEFVNGIAETMLSLANHSKTFLDYLLKSASNSHNFAHRFHR